MKNAKIFLTIFAAVLFTVAMTAVPLWAADHYVRTDGNDGNDGLANTSAGAWLTISYAIVQVSDDDIINVADGTYTITETITVDKGITITGNTITPENVLVTYAAPQSIPAAQHTCENSGFSIGAANITIQGIKVKNCKFGFYFSRSNTTYTGCTITNCAIDAASMCGIGEVATPSTIISNNTITYCSDKGIYVRLCDSTSPATRTEVTGNAISNCGEYYNAAAIQTLGSKYVYIFNNTITSTFDKGINIIGSNAASIAERIEVIDNDISGTEENAIQLTDWEDNTCYPRYTYIHGNTINNVDDNGIVVTEVEARSVAERVEVSNNTISNTGFSGIEVSYISPYTYVHNNTISDIGTQGINILETYAGNADMGVEISDNTISNCYYQGINIDWSSPYTYVYNNTLTKCNYYGADGTGDWDYASIHVGEKDVNNPEFTCHHTVIDNNTINDGINGIQIWSDNCTVTNNTIYNMGMTYADTKGTAGVGDGVYYNSGIIIGTNWLTDNFKPTGTTIIGNSIYDNVYGLYVRDYATLSGGDPSVLSVTAEYNWWGSASGPDDDAGAIDGTGDIISVNVDADPWLDNSVDDFEKVATTNQTSIGPSGGLVKVTITSTPDASNYLDVYQAGSLSGAPVTSEIYPSGFDKRSNIVWGILETGEVAANLVFEYSNQPGISEESTIRILKRDNAQEGSWILAPGQSTPVGKTITINGVSSFSEFTIGAGGDNSLPVELSKFTAISEKGVVVLKWTTESEIENLGFIVERRNWKLETGNWDEIASYKTHEELEGQGSVSHKTEYSYTDSKVQPGMTYEYRLADVSYVGVVEYHGTRKVTVKGSDEVILPEGFALKSVYPNPFNPETNISYALPEEAKVNLVIVDLVGREVRQLLNNEVRSQGNYIVKWDGTNDSGFNLSSGVYFVVLKAKGTVDMQKMVLFR
ncbi:MAG: right-handed parallel beta-helix repeat-containing protein [Candidatus Marinimicrobia bacterium]|nr:right-handed parallel beta-helix repeat-containing protein [Candidatus Neomarinimicrobiota bacterium]